MKVAGANPAPSAPVNDMGGDDMGEPAPMDDMQGNDKPFDDEPFDAGVDADEESDPKKFIEQLTGKLGQSLRKYTEEQGQPDFDLEKFAINSLLAATHTSEMDAEDQKDIINKVKSAGRGDEEPSPESDMDMPSDEEIPSEDPMGDEAPIDEPNGEEEITELILKENIHFEKLKGLKTKSVFNRKELKMILDMLYQSVDISGQYRIGELYRVLGFPWGESTMGNLFVNPKKNNMFQPGSNDILDEACWKGYKQIGMKDKGGKQVPNCVPINEEEGMHAGESQNYMFWQNLKTIHHASGELLGMNQQQVDEMVTNGHAWAVDHIATSSDDIEEVYHFFEANLDSNEGDYYGETESGYEDEFGSVETINLNEAEYKGKEVELGKVKKGDVKKFKVFVKNKKGNVIKVNFGDPNMEIKRDDPERRKSFRARHKCAQAKDRTTPKYWSCKMWSKKPVSKMVGEGFDNSEKNSIFDKNYFKIKLNETFNQDDTMNEPMTKPAPVVIPTEKPVVTPSRKNKPFLPIPEVTPDPKAKDNG